MRWQILKIDTRLSRFHRREPQERRHLVAASFRTVVVCVILVLSLGVSACSRDPSQHHPSKGATWSPKTPLSEASVCGVVPNSYLKDHLSFYSVAYSYDNHTPKDGVRGHFSCYLTALVSEDDAPFIWIKYNEGDISNLDYEGARFSDIKIPGRKGVGRARNDYQILLWVFPDGDFLELEYGDDVKLGPLLNETQRLKFVELFGKLIDDVPTYNRNSPEGSVQVPA